jgi:hypothetical protein
MTSKALSRGRILGLAISIGLTFAALDRHVVARQAANRLDREVIRETVESLASVVNREYFDPVVGARVATSLEQWLSQGRYAGRRYATESPGVPDRNETRPVYVLTAERTFSAGEGFAFLLQERRRAEVIGEATAGAANPGRPYPVGVRLEVTVPNGHVRTAVTGRNWEGAGVIPDVRVAGSDALRVGHIRALRELLKQAPSGPWHDALKRHVDALEGQDKREGRRPVE